MPTCERRCLGNRIRDFEKLIAFLNQLYDAIWEMYYNGRRPKLRRMRYAVRSLVAKNLKELRNSPTQEHIVADTRKCMFLVTEAAKSLPAGFGRS